MSDDLLMATAYTDVEDVSRLLAEKQRDLELAAMMGKSLLDRNHELKTQNLKLLEQNQQYSEQLYQLTYSVAAKEAQLNTYIQDFEKEIKTLDLQRDYHGVDVIEKKIKELENENTNLKTKADQLRSDVAMLQEREQLLQAQSVQQLQQLHDRLNSLQNELLLKASLAVANDAELDVQQKHIVSLTDTSSKLMQENTLLQQRLFATEQAQDRLHEEVKDWKARYVECCDMLTEAQHQLLCQQQGGHSLNVHQQLYSTQDHFILEISLAKELEDSIRQDLQLSHIVTVPPLNWDIVDNVLDAERHVRRITERHHSDTNNNSVHYTDSCCFSDDGEDLFSPCFIDSELVFTSTHSQRNERHRPDSDTVKPDNRSPECYTSFIKVNVGNSSTVCQPSRIELVKPMQGSLTLSQWQRLATPHLASVLERRPGVQVRGDTTSNQDETIINNTTQVCTSSNPCIGRNQTRFANSYSEKKDASKGEHFARFGTPRLVREFFHGHKCMTRLRVDLLSMHRTDCDGFLDTDTGLNTVMLIRRWKRWHCHNGHNGVIDRCKAIDLLASSKVHGQGSDSSPHSLNNKRRAIRSVTREPGQGSTEKLP